MSREDQIKQALQDLAPWALSIAIDAQNSKNELGGNDLRKWLPRRASENQVVGTTRWRRASDQAVMRTAEMAGDFALTSTDGDHNGGRYYWRSASLGVVFTIRQHAHKDDKKPDALQIQIEQVIKEAPVTYGDETTVYLCVPPVGHEPRFEVSTTGAEVVAYELRDLLPDPAQQQAPFDSKAMPSSGTVIGSEFDEARDGVDGGQHDAATPGNPS